MADPGSDPARPRPDRPRDDEDQLREEDQDGAAILRERGDGAHEEKVGDDANLRADDTAPGV